MLLKVAAAAAIFIAITGAGWKGYTIGKNEVLADWNAAKAKSAIAAAESARKQQETADSVAQTVHQAALRDRVVYRTITKEVVRVQNDCPASADFRVLHDSAATATVPDFSATGVNAATAPAQDVAETVTDNYESCRDTMRRLEALQALIRSYNGD